MLLYFSHFDQRKHSVLHCSLQFIKLAISKNDHSRSDYRALSCSVLLLTVANEKEKL